MNFVVKSFLEDKTTTYELVYLDTLYNLGPIYTHLKEYKEAYKVYKALLDYVQEYKIDINEKIIENVTKECQELLSVIQNQGSSENNKQVPYSSSKKKKTLRGKPYQRLKIVSAQEQKEKMEQLWKGMEENKMDIEEGSKWYLISTVWFNQWKEW